MLRKAFVMALKPGSELEYERRHNPIPDELAAVLTSHGVHNYSIFLDSSSGRLFAYAEIESEAQWQSIAETDACKRWWRDMVEVMYANPDDSPVSILLKEVFHLN